MARRGSARIAPFGNALVKLARLAEMVGHEHGLAVPRHQSVDSSEQYSRRHGSEYGTRVAAPNLANAFFEAWHHPDEGGHQGVAARS